MDKPKEKKSPTSVAPTVDWQDRYVRLAADFENYQKRQAESGALAREQSVAEIVREFLPVLDNLERSLASVGTSENNSAFVAGVAHVRDQFVAQLIKLGIAEIPTSELDPGLHEVVAVRGEGGRERIAEVVERGWRIGETVIRHAKVVVERS